MKNCLPCARRFVVGCIEFDWVMGCGLGWFVGPKFLLCDGLGWVGSVIWWVSFGWVKEIGPMDNPGSTACVRNVFVLIRVAVQVVTQLKSD